VPDIKAQAQGSLRRANLVNRSESFLLEALTAGYNLNEIQQAIDLAMGRADCAGGWERRCWPGPGNSRVG